MNEKINNFLLMFTLHTHTQTNKYTHIMKYLISQVMASITTSCETHTPTHRHILSDFKACKSNGKRFNLHTYRHLWRKRKV